MPRLGITLLFISLAAILPVASADWVLPEHGALVAASDIVLTGSYIGARQRCDSGREVGILSVERLYKGAEVGHTIQLRLPPERPGGLVSSGDMLLVRGQRGLWYLNRGDDGLYYLDAPYRFIPREAIGSRLGPEGSGQPENDSR